MLNELLDLLGKARVFDLSQPYYVGMPHHPNHPPYIYGLSKAHGETVLAGGVSAAAESIALGGHVGTHIDSLAHFSKQGMLHSDVEAAQVQSQSLGMSRHGVDTIAPIARRGVLLDVAQQLGRDVLDEDQAVDADLLEKTATAEGVEVRAGDVVLIRTGWAQYWGDAGRYINGVRGPGPNEEGARWLSQKQVFAGGSDTVAFEVVPNRSMPVHVHLLVESGIHIIEALEMEGLSKAQVYEFSFIAAPLKLQGATGAPIRPLAFA